MTLFYVAHVKHTKLRAQERMAQNGTVHRTSKQIEIRQKWRFAESTGDVPKKARAITSVCVCGDASPEIGKSEHESTQCTAPATPKKGIKLSRTHPQGKSEHESGWGGAGRTDDAHKLSAEYLLPPVYTCIRSVR